MESRNFIILTDFSVRSTGPRNARWRAQRVARAISAARRRFDDCTDPRRLNWSEPVGGSTRDVRYYTMRIDRVSGSILLCVFRHRIATPPKNTARYSGRDAEGNAKGDPVAYI